MSGEIVTDMLILFLHKTKNSEHFTIVNEITFLCKKNCEKNEIILSLTIQLHLVDWYMYYIIY